MGWSVMAKVRLYRNPGSGEKKYKITAVESLSIEKKTDATRLALPEMSESEQDIVRMFGVEMDISLTFKIVDDGTDKSETTNDTPVVTVWEQMDYLLENFLTKETDDVFKIEIFDRDGSSAWSREGVITSLTINLRKGETAFECSLKFAVGNVI